MQLVDRIGHWRNTITGHAIDIAHLLYSTQLYLQHSGIGKTAILVAFLFKTFNKKEISWNTEPGNI